MTDTSTTRPLADVTPADTAPLWALARQSVAWLDAKNGRGQHETLMRIGKIAEEYGEVMQAYIGMVGQNPRKGVTHSVDDVAAELCDVVFSALVALATVVPDAEAVLDRHARRVSARIAAVSGEDA